MDWITRLNAAIAYLEEHLLEEIPYEALAQITCCSSYHFQRMFGYMAGVPLSEYMRRRRMSRAAEELQSGNDKIIDIAAKYGYESPTAFNRAFQSIHGFAPSQAREEGKTLTFFPAISFQITIKGAVQMDYKIETKEAFRAVGVSFPLEKDFSKNMPLVPKYWEQVYKDGTIPKLCTLMNSQPKGILGISSCNDADAPCYWICVASTCAAEGLEECNIPATTWAIFPGNGSAVSIQQLMQRIVTEWLPSSGYEYGNSPDVEVYLNDGPNVSYEVWVPVVKK